MNIDEQKDKDDLEKLVTGAKNGKWDDVFFHLGKKNHLLNCIPEGRAWATLHQAVYWKDASIITKLMSYDNFDALLRTKEYSHCYVAANSTALTIAKKNESDKIYNLLQENILNHRRTRLACGVMYVISRKGGEKIRDSRIPPFIRELITYKESLLDSTDDVITIMSKLMKKKFPSEDNSWSNIQATLNRILYAFCRRSCEDLFGAGTENGFFEKLITIYTSNRIYKKIHAAFETEENRQGYSPPSENLGLTLYALLQDIVVMYWSNLHAVSSNTYRGVEHDITSQFYVGDEILFTNMLSCCKSHGVADTFRCKSGQMGTMIVIDNDAVSKMRPRYIANISDFPHEEECLYPIGAEFRVTYVNPLTKTVCLQLLA